MKSYTTLVVDDDAAARDIAKEVLEESGLFDVVGEACDGKEAIDRVEMLLPEVVLLDLSMPVMNGYQVLEAIEESVPGTRVIVMTQHSRDLVRRRVRALGGLDVLEKGFDPTTLAEEVMEILEGTPVHTMTPNREHKERTI